MFVLSGTDRDTLSQDQHALLTSYRDHWKAVRNDTSAVDRSAAEEGVALAYSAAGLAQPERIVWCRSPIEIERHRRMSWFENDPGISVKRTVVDDVARNVAARIENDIPVRIRVETKSNIEVEAAYFSASSALTNALNESAEHQSWPWSAKRAAVSTWLKRQSVTPYSEFSQSRWLQHEAIDFLAKCAYLRNVGGFQAQTAPLRGLWLIATNAGAIAPHARTCWISERHDSLSMDEHGRLHNPTGPAVRYPDGWAVYSWKGVAVPRWLIEQPSAIRKRHIDRERNPMIRHCMIDILTPERFISTGAAVRIAEDEVGVLWRSQWRDWWDAWATVEVVNGTAEPDGTFKHYFLQVPPDMRTPTEAVAWTYGISPERYEALDLRT